MKQHILLMLTACFSLHAFVPFNPIIHTTKGPGYDVGDAYFADPNNPSAGIVGWLDVLDVKDPLAQKDPYKKLYKHDRVLAVKYKNDPKDKVYSYTYVAPDNLGKSLPKGLFFWLSTAIQENSTFADFSKHAQLFDQKPSLSLKVRPDNQKSFKWDPKSQTYVNYDASLAQYKDPSPYISTILSGNSTLKDKRPYHIIDAENKRLDRLGFFYDVVGVTEQYFRDFFGDPIKLPQMNMQNNQLVVDPSRLATINSYFTNPKAKGFDDAKRSAIVGGCVVETVGKISNDLQQKYKNSTPPNLGNGSIAIIDGYKIYADAGGKFPGDPGFNANNIQNTIDSNGAYAGRITTDIRKLLTDQNFNNAVIQVASTHALLEGHAFKPESQLTGMLAQPVQGEEVALATAGASFDRKYRMPQMDIFKNIGGSKNIGSGSLSDAAINKIEIGWQPDVPVTSGYLSSSVYYEKGNPITYISPNTSDEEQARIEWYINQPYSANKKKGQKNPNVVNIFQKNRNIYNLFNKELDAPLTQTVNLALCAAHDMSRAQNQSPKDKADAHIILRAMYKGTLELAALHGKRKVILTLLGAGAFAGPYSDDILSWIISALQENLDTISKYGLEVTIINYPDLRPHRMKTRKEVDAFRAGIENIKPQLKTLNQNYISGTGIGPVPTPGALEDKLKGLTQALNKLSDELKK